MLAPIFNNGHRRVFEFDSGHVLHVARSGEIEVRFIAVDRLSGQVCTRTHGTFHSKYLGLAAKCLRHLEGTMDLFPPQPRADRGAPQIPTGEAALSFGQPRATRADDSSASSESA